jgi:hypothetical protein
VTCRLFTHMNVCCPFSGDSCHGYQRRPVSLLYSIVAVQSKCMWLFKARF